MKKKDLGQQYMIKKKKKRFSFCVLEIHNLYKIIKLQVEVLQLYRHHA